MGSVTLQTVHDWVMRFNAHGPGGLINGKAPGPQSRLNDPQRAALAQAIERDRGHISMASCAGVCVIWPSGYGRNSVSR
ncbi:MAG: helix-turn-helix domain-containing protein [Sinorhizobium meliloti]|nr:helix-turn-helix domain-containing protein [Sinorhizobium meliloti]